MGSTTFIVMGNYKYYHLLTLNIHHILKVYPDAQVLVYDWGDRHYAPGFKHPSQNVTVIDWGQAIKDTSHLESQLDATQQIDIAIRFNARFERTFLQRIKKKLLKTAPRSALARPLIKSGMIFENMLMQKIPCMMDASARLQSGKMVFLDADAFLIQNIDDILGRNDFDIAITLIEKPCHEINQCSVINSGVLFFGDTPQKRNAFLGAWNNACAQCTEWLREQTSMVRMLAGRHPDIFTDNALSVVDLDDQTIAILSLPQRTYNNTDHHCLNGPDLPRIVHFANTGHNETYFKTLQAQLENIGARPLDGDA